MNVVNASNVVYFDVDETLILWDAPPENKTLAINAWGITVNVAPSAETITRLVQHKAQGHYVVVWSQAGHEWAHAVLDGLKLIDYVNVCMTKPKWMYDDLSPQAWTQIIDLNKKSSG